MKNIFYLFIPVLFFSTYLFSQDEVEDFKKQHSRLYENKAAIKPQIQLLVEGMSDGVHMDIDGEKIYDKIVLEKFYKYIDYEPAWKDHEVLKQAIIAIEGSYDDGLVPEDYHVDALDAIVKKIKNSEKKGIVDYEWVAKFDLLMTDAIMLYAYHLLEGKIDPHELDVQWNFGYADLPGGDGKQLARL